eukprot:522672-Amphidinium_carterae.1
MNLDMQLNHAHHHLMPQVDMQRLQGLVSLLPAGTKRTTLSQANETVSSTTTLAFGAKCTRQHGLTKASTDYSDTIRDINQAMRRLLPFERWQSLAVVRHGDIPWHQDSMDFRAAYMLSITESPVRLSTYSELRGLSPSFEVQGSVGFFDPTASHKVTVADDTTVTSLVLYTPARPVDAALVLQLRDLGFPADVEPRDFPFAQQFEDASAEAETDNELESDG